MPAMEVSDLHQIACYWALSTYGDYGETRMGALTDAVQLNVRWEERKSQAINPQGNTVATDVMVIVDRVVTPGGMMWLGEKDDLPSAVSSLTDVYQIIEVRAIPDVKNRHTRRRCKLMRYSDTLPVT